MENPRDEPFIRFKLHAILSRVQNLLFSRCLVQGSPPLTLSAPGIPFTLSWGDDPGPLKADDPPSDTFSEGQ